MKRTGWSMAKAKKKAKKAAKESAKSAKKSVRKVAKAAAAPARKRRPAKKAVVLTPEERQRLPKPRGNWQELIEEAVGTWKKLGRPRIDGLSASRLERLGAAADKAGDKERALIAEQERRLQPLSDARLVAESVAWEGILELNRAVKYHGRKDPELVAAFRFLADAMRGERASSDDGAKDAEPPAEPPAG